MREKTIPQARISPFVLLLIFVSVAFSIFMIYRAMEAYQAGGDGSYFLMLGLIMLALSAYMFFQMRRGAPKISLGAYQVNTTILCQKCGFKNIRSFERGDFLFKEMGPCPKCNEKMFVSSIYREAEESKS